VSHTKIVGSQFPSHPTGHLTPSLARLEAGVIQQVASSEARVWGRQGNDETELTGITEHSPCGHTDGQDA